MKNFVPLHLSALSIFGLIVLYLDKDSMNLTTVDPGNWEKKMDNKLDTKADKDKFYCPGIPQIISSLPWYCHLTTKQTKTRA